MPPWNAIIVLIMMRFATSLSAAPEELKFRGQMKPQKKPPPVTTIQTTYGDWYDCVDFYEQPAFDHPMLKRHKYDYQMSSSQPLDRREYRPSDIWVNGKGCPSHTVPIRKVDKYDVVRANMAAEQVYNLSANPTAGDGRVVSVLRTKNPNKYYGGGMVTGVYHLSVQKNQYSSSRIKIENGPDSIAVGWTVNPSLYPDFQTRLFIYTITKSSRCYNTYCPGFIILRSDIPLDLLLKPYSTPGGPVYEKKLFVIKDPINGNWFLQIGLDNTTVGSWPKKIFTKLSDSANYVEWGGEVYSPVGTLPPPMGAGDTPRSGKLIDNCYGRQVTLINDKHQVDYNPPGCSTYSSSPLYEVIDVGNQGGNIQRVILFGSNSD